MKTIVSIPLFLYFFLMAINGHGVQHDTESPRDIAKRLQNQYDNLQSLSFNFYQNTKGEITGRPQRGSGKAIFYRDSDSNYMRWDYTYPSKQVLFSDGVDFSMYFESLSQMIVTSAENLDTDLTYSFFTGKNELIQNFHIHPPDKNSQSYNKAEFNVIKLIPKIAQSQVQDIHLWVTTSSLIRRIKISDHFGTITLLNLSDIKLNGLMDKTQPELKTLFFFIPPKETEIIRQ